MRLFFFVIFVLHSALAQDFILNNTPVAVYFSPDGGATKAIVSELKVARSEVLVQAYSFTSAPIAKALVEARARGVNVVVLIDKGSVNGKLRFVDGLAKRGVQVLIDDKHAIAHNKVMIIDRQIVITGSFNFTKAAEESNAENLLIIKNAEFVDTYVRNFLAHSSHALAYFKK